jgi:predicted nucleic acid-binding protein
MEALVADDPAVVTWWGTPIECASAIGRRARSDPAGARELAVARRKLVRLESEWIEVTPSERVREQARRLVQIHDLRAADALQLAAALVASGWRDETIPVVTLDERLALAASREGFPILPATAAG